PAYGLWRESAATLPLGARCLVAGARHGRAALSRRRAHLDDARELRPDVRRVSHAEPRGYLRAWLSEPDLVRARGTAGRVDGGGRDDLRRGADRGRDLCAARPPAGRTAPRADSRSAHELLP